MKKVLGFLGVLILNSSVGLTTVACNTNNSDIRIYNSVGSGLESLNLNSFAIVKENVDATIKGIKDDVINGLYKLKFASGINIYETKVIINSEDVINLATNGKLVENDLLAPSKLKLQVTANYFNVHYQLDNVNLLVANKTIQQINSYVDNYNYNSIFLGSYKMLPPGIDINIFPSDLKNMIFSALGSFADSFISKDKLKFTSIFEQDKSLNQVDLNDFGKLNLTINYNYKDNFDTFNISLNIAKINIEKFISIPWVQQVIYLPNEKILTAADAAKINQALKDEIYMNLSNTSELNLSDYKITEQDYSVLPFNEFIAGQSVADGSTIPFIFNIITNPNSKIITGTLINKSIIVTIFVADK